jgi:hypothetical protein
VYSGVSDMDDLKRLDLGEETRNEEEIRKGERMVAVEVCACG